MTSVVLPEDGRVELPDMDVAGRLERLRDGLADAGCGALLVTALPNIRYLTGFTGSAAMLLVLPGDAVLATDGRYRTQAAQQLAAAGVTASIEIGPPARQHEALAAAAPAVGRVGLEADHISWARQRALAADVLAGRELVPTTGAVERLRRRKDPGEVARIEVAARIADAALARVLPLLRDEVSEQDFALELDFTMRRLGADGPSFDTIVASGPNGAKPHARPSPRRAREGELVVIDFGALVDGYHSDMTRTVSLGPPATATLQRVLDVVAASQQAGVAAVAAGVPCRDVDGTCRQVIAEAGWADAFVHSTGHGVGLDIHEAPALSSTSGDTLDAGQVVTVEPGVYLPDQGGARVEDTVVVTGGGCRRLTNAPKDPIVS